MVTKILFTLAVIGLVFWLARHRRTAVVRPRPSTGDGRLAKRIALTVLAVMVGGALVVGYWRWRHDHQILQVSVIDGTTGRVTLYRVPRNRFGGHSFVTVDGRRVQLAETDRLEVVKEPPD